MVNVNIFKSCFAETSSYKVNNSSTPEKSKTNNSTTTTAQPQSVDPQRSEDSQTPPLDSDSSDKGLGSSTNSSPAAKISRKIFSYTLPRVRKSLNASRSRNLQGSSASSMGSGSMGSTSSESVISSDDARSTCSTASMRSSPEPSNEDRIPSPDDDAVRSGRSDGSFSEACGLVGLRNIGNTCYLNSILQCLSNTRCLLEYLTKDAFLGDLNTSPLSSMKGDLMNAFAALVKEMWAEGDSNRAINTGPFKTQVQRFASVFSGYQQHDAQEFLRKLLEGLHEDVNRVTIRPKPLLTDIDDDLSDDGKAMEAWKRYIRYDDSKLVDMFVGVFESKLRCTSCNYSSLTFDPFWDLSLELPSKTGNIKLQQCLDRFTADEILDGDEKPKCSKCKERVRMTKSFSIQKFPKVLVLHLKRFSPTERWRGKLSNMVEFPLENLDLSRYASSNSRSPHTYNLLGVANHSGTTYSGHYMAYCKHPYQQSWHEYNDSRVTSIPPKRVCSPEAYVLFYELCSL